MQTLLGNELIMSVVRKWCDATKQRTEANLKRRGLVAQLPLISDVSYTISEQDNVLLITFNFEHKKANIMYAERQLPMFKKLKEMGIVKPLAVTDPLTGKVKPFIGTGSKERGKAPLGFLRRANVYMLIQTTYSEELIENIIAEVPEIAGRLAVQSL